MGMMKSQLTMRFYRKVLGLLEVIPISISTSATHTSHQQFANLINCSNIQILFKVGCVLHPIVVFVVPLKRLEMAINARSIKASNCCQFLLLYCDYIMQKHKPRACSLLSWTQPPTASSQVVQRI